jgi:hypothetical protein
MTACSINTSWVKINIFFFEKRSTKTPAKRENSIIGINWHIPTMPTFIGELVTVYTSQVWAALCIHVPVREMHWPNKKSLKFLY